MKKKKLLPLLLTLIIILSFATPVSAISDSVPSYAIVHYSRTDNNYGDHTTGDYNDFWGVHFWGDIAETFSWTSPKPFLGEDDYGRIAWVALEPGAENVGFIIHRGDVKDGTDADRFFNPSINPEIWLKNDDATTYTSQAEAQGYVTIHYHRPDGTYGDLTSDDYNDFWGLHLWGDAINPSEATEWTSPMKPSGLDDYGVFWNVQIVDTLESVNFIIHRGDDKDPGPDQSFVPINYTTIWIKQWQNEIYTQRGEVDGYAILHYHRPAGDYGDPTRNDYNEFWGLHTWDGASDPGWTTPRKPDAFDTFGAIFMIDLLDNAEEVGYILHRGDVKDPGPDQFLILATHGYEVWQLQDADPDRPYILPVLPPLVNTPPNLTIDEENVVVNEGGMATNSGSVSDIDGDAVVLTASVGSLIDNNDGTWSWSLITGDGPNDSQTVMIIAGDGNGGTCQSTFELIVDNVAPIIIEVANDSPVIAGGSSTINTEVFDPAGANDPLTYSFDCDNNGIFEIGPQAENSAMCSFIVPGDYTIQIMVTDDDGGAMFASTTVTVLSPSEAVDEFIGNEIEVLVSDEDLNQGQGQALLSKLANIKKQLDKGNIKVAIKVLEAFINLTEAFIKSGILTQSEGQTLTDAADYLIATIDH